MMTKIQNKRNFFMSHEEAFEKLKKIQKKSKEKPEVKSNKKRNSFF